MPPEKKKKKSAGNTAVLAGVLASAASRLKKPINIMEICGTHTMDISRYGLRKLMPENIRLISGPGCPVCVTPIETVDKAIEISRMPGSIIVTFGDMMRVPGTRSTLAEEKAKGSDIRVVYSPRETLKIAAENPDKNAVFIGVGFETTAPAVALAVKEAAEKGIKNMFVLSAFKVLIPAMEALLSDKKLEIDGFLAPGHVSAIIGSKPYEYICRKYKRPCVVTGFEAQDIMQGILMLCLQAVQNEARAEIQYKRAVKRDGNKIAAKTLKAVFNHVDSNWRGIGIIPKSGMDFSPAYRHYSADFRFRPDTSYSKEPAGCRCGDVLKGCLRPDKCPLFARKCTPATPVGACMVSSEGSCAAYYKYERQHIA